LTNLDAAEVSLAWEAPTNNLDGTPLTNLGGYRLYCRPADGAYGPGLDVGNVTRTSVSDLEEGTTYCFAVKTYNSSGSESPFSEQLVWYSPDVTPPLIVGQSQVTLIADDEGRAELPDLSGGLTVSDNCSSQEEVTIAQTPAPGTLLYVGTEVVTLTATDEAGNSGYFAAVVTVADDAFNNRRPTLAWEATEGATWYYIWMSRNGKTYYRKWLRQTATIWTPDFDLPGGDYKWWIRAWGRPSVTRHGRSRKHSPSS